MENKTKNIWRWLQVAMLLIAGTGGYAAALLVLGAASAPADVNRMAECIRKLAEYNNGQTSERLQQRGVVEHFYNREHACASTELTM